MTTEHEKLCIRLIALEAWATSYDDSYIAQEAATAIRTLSEENERLRTALESLRGIGRKDHTNPKYDAIYATADQALVSANGAGKAPKCSLCGDAGFQRSFGPDNHSHIHECPCRSHPGPLSQPQGGEEGKS